MLRSMPIRRFKRGFKLGLIKLLIGDKAAGVHLSYVGRGASADLYKINILLNLYVSPLRRGYVNLLRTVLSL